MNGDLARAWLASLICRQPSAWPAALADSGELILAVAAEQGVTGLAHERLATIDVDCPETIRLGFAKAAKDVSAISLLQQSEARRILAKLAEAQLPVLLLKGSALAHWLYASATVRECSDIDLLFATRAEAEKAVVVLRGMGYARRELHLPGDLICFEITCVLESGVFPGLEVDVHWKLSSSPIYAFRFANEELRAHSQPIARLAASACGLSAVHAYLHACIHRALNISSGLHDNLNSLYDIHLLGQLFSAGDWAELVAEATTRGLAGTCLDGINAASTAFHHVAPAHVTQTLAQSEVSELMDVSRMGDWLYLQRMSFLAFPTWVDRLRWFRQRVVPDWNYLVEYYGQDKGPMAMLAKRMAGGWRRLLQRSTR